MYIQAPILLCFAPMAAAFILPGHSLAGPRSSVAYGGPLVPTRLTVSSSGPVVRQWPCTKRSNMKLFSTLPGDEDEEDEDLQQQRQLTEVEAAATAGGLMAAPVVLYSLAILRNPDLALPAIPGAHIELFSYMMVMGIAAWSITTLVKTGRGLPLGAGGMTGIAESLCIFAAGMSSLTWLAEIHQHGLPELSLSLWHY